MADRIILKVSDAKVFTDGNIYGKQIYLEEGMSAERFYEITDEEYEQIINDDDATEEDYLQALERLGVSE